MSDRHDLDSAPAPPRFGRRSAIAVIALVAIVALAGCDAGVAPPGAPDTVSVHLGGQSVFTAGRSWH